MRELFLDIIKEFAVAPETQIDEYLAIRCNDFFKKANSTSNEEIVTFLRNLLDDCVYTGSSDFCVIVLSQLLKNVSNETEDEKTVRRRNLENNRRNSAV